MCPCLKGVAVMANGLTDEQKKRREEIVEKLRRATLTEPVRFGLHPIADPDGVWALMKAIEELQKRFPSILTVFRGPAG
jgi:hypothetical protein